MTTKIVINANITANVPDKVAQKLISKYGNNSIPKPWSIGEKYYYVNTTYGINCCQWNVVDHIESMAQVDMFRYETGNMFKTKEEAEEHAEWLKSVAIIRRSSNFDPRWSNPPQRKWYVEYGHGEKEPSAISYALHPQNGVPYRYKPQDEVKEALLADPEVKHAYEVVFGVAE